MILEDGRKLVTEAEFMAGVVDLARLQGWLAYYIPDSRRSPAGFPDLILAKTFPPASAWVLALELKSKRGKATADQNQWINTLGQAPGVIALVVYPSDWDNLTSLLSGSQGIIQAWKNNAVCVDKPSR